MPRYPNNVSDGHSGGALNLAIHVLILSCIEVCYIKLAYIYIEDIHIYRERERYSCVYIYIYMYYKFDVYIYIYIHT